MKSKFKVNLPEYLKDKRTSKELTLKEVAAYANVSLGYISRIEQGSSTPTNDMLKTLGTILEFNLSDVVESDDSNIDERIAFEDIFKKFKVEIANNAVRGAQILSLIELINYIETMDWDDADKKVEHITKILFLVDKYKKGAGE